MRVYADRRTVLASQNPHASAINEIDLGPVSRALVGSKIVEGIILSMFDKEAKFIDYGAGYGLLVWNSVLNRGFDFLGIGTMGTGNNIFFF